MQERACIYFSFQPVPLLLLFLQDICIRTEVLGLLPSTSNNNSFKDTEVKLAVLHMYFGMLTSTCTVSCALYLLTCRSEFNTNLLTSLLTSCFDLLASTFPCDCISRCDFFQLSFFSVCFLKHQKCVQV